MPALLVALVTVCWGAWAAPAGAEPRRVGGLHLFAERFGIELQREGPAGGAWLAGVSLAPTGFYGGIRRYESARGADRTFWSVYGTVDSSGSAFDEELAMGVWASAGYEIRLDASAAGSGEMGFGLVGTGKGLRPAIFIGLSLGWRLP